MTTATGSPESFGPDWVEDMTGLPNLSETSILQNLKKRFAAGYIYTYTGSILVAVNPYKTLDIFGHASIAKYQSKDRRQNPPHIYALSDATITNIRNERKNQSVIISGESGSGKSESTKYILNYLTAVTSSATNASWIHQQILEANTVLESFGNAKTSRNNNSSRFGKFINVQLDRKLQIVGANITSYLLEKSRVARQAKLERNYHVFYELVAGANEDEIRDYLIKPVSSYYYLAQSECTEIPGINERSKFEGLKFSLTVLNVSFEQTDCIWRVLSAILWLGNVKFKSDNGNESVTIDGTEAIANISSLLGVNADSLSKVLCFKKLVVRSETTMVPLKPSQATDNRDSIAKNLYSSLFRVLLEMINSTLQASPDKDIQNSIGVLDIFGFEEFQVNSFEQFCINYTNEKLQNFFNQFIFKLEQEEYEREGINWEKISYEDNQACIDLIEAKPVGILAQLDEEGKLPRGTEESFLIKLEKTHEKHKNFTKPKTKTGVFGIKHYAGEVLYHVEGFLEKNKDALQDELFDLLSSSQLTFVASLITPKDTVDNSALSAPGTPRLGASPQGSMINVHQSSVSPSPSLNPMPARMTAKAVKPTAGGAFKNSLNSLVTTLGLTTTHYVRCIKPNSLMEAFAFEDSKVLGQLKYSGMLETIKIRKAGFPLRIPYEQFNIENRFILPPEAKTSADAKYKATVIAEACQLPDGTWQTGHSKIFLKAEMLPEIQKRVAEYQTASVITIQRYVRGYQARTKFLHMRENAIIIQKHVKGYLYVIRYKRKRAAIIKIQSVARGWFARDLCHKLREAKEKELREEMERKERELQELRALEAAEMERQATERMVAELRAAQLKLQEAAQQDADANKSSEQTLKEAAAISAIDSLIGKVQAVESREALATDTIETSDAPKATTADNKLEEIFSLIKDFNSHDELSSLAQNLTSEINQLNEKKKVLLSNENVAEISVLSPSKENIADDPIRRSLHTNPLIVHQAGSVLAELSEGKMDPFADALSLQSFGELHFATNDGKPRKKSILPGLGSKKTTIGAQDINAALKYSKTSLSAPITRIPEGDPSYSLALECSKLLSRALDPSNKKSEDICLAMHQIANLGLVHVALRDEIFIQIIKQVTLPTEGEPKGWNDITLNGWQLLTLCIGTFPPSKTFSKFLLAFILRGCKTNTSTKRMLSLTAELFSKSVLIYGPRKFAPSPSDIQSFRDGVVNKLCKIYVMDGHSFDILISPVTTADEVVKEISKKFKLKDTSSWSLYVVSQNSDKAIRSVEYLADCMLGLQKESKRGTFLSRVVTKHAPNGGIDVDDDFKLTLKKRIFKDPKEDFRSKDETEIHLLCCQADNEVNTDFYPIGLREGVKLAALKAHIMLGDYDPHSPELPHSSNILQWITPRVMSKASKENAARMVIEEYIKLKGLSPIEAKLIYLETVRAFRFYGAAIFEIEAPGDLSFNEPIDVAVSAIGVQLVQSVSREIAMVFTADEIKDVQLDGRTVSIIIGKPSEASTEVYEFASERAEEMASLIRDYCGIRALVVRERIYSDNDIANLNRDVEGLQSRLLEHECVRVPGPDTLAAEMGQAGVGGAKTIRGSLIMPKSMMAMKSAASNSRTSSPSSSRKKNAFPVFGKVEVPPGLYNDVDWSFSTTKLASSILAPVHDASDFAINLNLFILEYIGNTKAATLDRSSKLSTAFGTSIQRIQRLFEQCIELPILANELYLQLIKMTRTHEDKTSYACIQMWRLMCVSVGVVVPTIPEIMDYLKAHLRRCEAIDPKDKLGEKERSKYAKYALKGLYQTIRGGKRLHPPSSEEISCAMKRSPMTIRFYALNRQFRALPIHPSDSIETIYCNLMEKFGLAEASGFAIYQYYAKSELALFAEDKISDVIFKCEKASHASQTADKVHFIIKKRLFDEPLKPTDHPVEDEFVRWQVVEDIKNDRYPLKPDDLIVAAGLTAQIQFGDAVLGAVESYQEFSTKVIPKRLLSIEMSEKVAEQHAKFVGKSGRECHDQFMALAKIQPLFGYTVFSVLQSYTNQLPRECWLAIGFDGIRILARRSLSIFATHPFADLINYIPAKNNILLVTENRTTLGTSKYVFSTENSLAIASLIKDYIDFHLDT
ncbi:hypothetical protein BCR33DRAFT_766571 [Rhizoclosmatium globosum]|uniref:Uncharacterized protein n=1 Tax=Rhizoclosmatium globosum TaxID=329046 RepID=A0A1Y2C8J7_9FUNG|nr:hypothetical protein BCR33DRAFT_766571 [Rhizoclosmatium globosum]|eukprot:ORY43349.1 hypothetical protein BCR33DRAFT_766571 [Rhizoclosmatium globosum]